jgi:hypothetical protein
VGCGSQLAAAEAEMPPVVAKAKHSSPFVALAICLALGALGAIALFLDGAWPFGGR